MYQKNARTGTTVQQWWRPFKRNASNPKGLKFFVCLVLIFGNFALSAQTVHNLNSTQQAATQKLKSNSAPQEFLQEAKAARVFQINPVLQNASVVQTGDFVELQLFENQSYTAKIIKIDTDINGNVTLSLKLPNYPMGFAIITTSAEGKSLVNVSIPELSLSFGNRYNTNSNTNYLIEIDESKISRPHFENDIMPVPEDMTVSANVAANMRAASNTANNCIPTAGENPNATATISLLVVYTLAAANSSYASSHGGINNVIATMIALGNTCFSNSQTEVTLQLVHSVQVAYTEDGNANNALSRLQNSSDGYMDNVHALRIQYSADLVQLISTDDGGGLGWIPNTSGTYDYGFSWVNVTQVGDDYPCSVHEIGHNMGLGHGAQHIDNIATGVFPYSQGWRWTGNQNSPYGTNKYGSVMTYWGGNNYSDGIDCYNVPYFSNPNVSYMGAATGNATQADAARSLREMKHVIANYSENKWAIGYPNAANVIATFDCNSGTLTISGTGAMQDFNFPISQPWHSNNDDERYEYITNVVINNGVTTIGDNAFSTCHNLAYVTIPSTVTSIGEGAFYNCMAMNSINIPNGVTDIKYGAFMACFGLTSINIPASVSSIGERAFGTPNGNEYAGHLTDVTVNWNTPLAINSNVFYGVNVANVRLHVPMGTENLYATAPVWKDFCINGLCSPSGVSIDNITSSVTTISNLSQSFTLTVSELRNRSATSLARRVGFALYNNTGSTEVGYLPARINFDDLQSGWGWTEFPTSVTLNDFSLTSLPARGTYRIYLVASENLSSPYRPYTFIKGVDSSDKYVTITILSDDATLSSLSVNEYSLSPSFSANTTNYTVTVPYSTTSATISAMKNESHATLTGTGSKSLNVGDNSFLVVVTAEGGNTKTYTVNIHRQSNNANLSSLNVNGYSLSPSFSAGTTNYTVTVPNSVTSRTISATVAESHATVSGVGSKSLNVGDNTFNVVVTAEDNSYTKTYTVTITREKATQTITFPTIATKIYGDAAVSLSATSTSGLPVSYQSSNTNVATISGSTLTIKGAGTATITASQSGNTNYEAATSVTRTLTVNKASLTITAEDKTRPQGQPNPEFTLAYNGFKNSENKSVLDVLPTISCTANINSPAGFYDIRLSGGTDNNYSYTLINGRLEVTATTGIDDVVANQLKIFPNPAKEEIFIKSDLSIQKVEIYTLTGALLLSENNFNEKISVSTLPQGIYLLKIYTDRGMAICKIVKE